MSEAGEKQSVKEMLELFGAIVLFSQLSTVGLILALAERRAVDPERVLEFYRVLAEAIETRPGSPDLAKASARMLREIEPMARNMTAIPAGAGRA